MRMKVEEAEDRVRTMYQQHMNKLDDAGLENFPTQRPRLAIANIMVPGCIQPNELRQRMKDVTQWREDEGFETKYFGRFVRVLAEEAKRQENIKVQIIRQPRGGIDWPQAFFSCDEDKDLQRGEIRAKQPGRRGEPRNKRPFVSRLIAPCSDAKIALGTANYNRKRERELPECLNKRCKGHHFLAQCPITS